MISQPVLLLIYQYILKYEGLFQNAKCFTIAYPQ